MNPVAHGGDNKQVAANPFAFIGNGGEGGGEPATIIGLRVAVKATGHETDVKRADANRLPVDAGIVGVGAVTVVKTSGSDRGNVGKAIFGTIAPVVVVVAGVKVIRDHAGVDPELVTAFEVMPGQPVGG